MVGTISICKPSSRLIEAKFLGASAMPGRHSPIASMSCTQFRTALSSGRQSSRLCTLSMHSEAVSTSKTDPLLPKFFDLQTPELINPKSEWKAQACE